MSRRWLNAAAGLAAVGLAGGFGYLAAISGPKPPAPEPPAFAIEPGVLDLGTVRQHETLKAAAKLVNRTPDTIEIITVGRSCSCTDTGLTKEHLGPGQSVDFTVGWHTGDKHGQVRDSVQVLARSVGGVRRHLTAPLQIRAEV